jgi:hypothetical protein
MPEGSAKTASNVEKKAVEVSRIPKQQQPETSKSIAADSDTTTSCQDRHPDGAVLNKEQESDGGTRIETPVTSSEQATPPDSLNQEWEVYIGVQVAESASSTPSEVLVAKPTQVPALAKEDEAELPRNIVVDEPTK